MQRGLPEPGEIIAEKYLVTGLIGRGGMGAVYVVEHRVTGKRLAVKCLLPEHSEQPELVERFLREAQAAGRIQHRNVVDVFDVGKDGELLYIVMELLDGKQLADLMRDQARPLDDMLAILVQAMDGVAAAHAHGIVHRDLKPENIMVCVGQSGRLDDPRVLDFGISKLEEEAASLPLTRSGVMMGTPYYMSFEQINSQRDLDQRVDVYAIGVILYEVMSGQVPYVAESVGALAIRMMSGPPRPLAELRPDLPTGLADVVMRSIARERDERYPTMQALIDAVRPFVEKELPAVPERARTSLPMTTPTRSSLRLSNGDAPTMRATPTPEGLRVNDDDDHSQRPAHNEGPPLAKFVFLGAAAVVFGGLAFALWPGGSAMHEAQGAQPAPARVESGSQAAVRAGASPGTGAKDVPAENLLDAAQVEVPAHVDAAALLGDDEEQEQEPAAPGKANKKKKKKGGRSLSDMVPQAPPTPENEREPADAAAPGSEAPKEEAAPAREEPTPAPAPAASEPAPATAP